MKHSKWLRTSTKNAVVSGILCTVIIWMSGCGEEQEKCAYIPDISAVSLSIEFEHLEDSMTYFANKQELVDFLTDNPVMRDQFFRRRDYPDDSVFINQLYKRFNHPGFDTLLMETKRVFGDLSSLKKQFTEAFSNLKFYYPDFTPPKIQTVISGLETDLVVTDTLIIIGLDYYLGKDGKYRPRIYDYLLKRYDPEDIVPSVLLLNGISEQFNSTDLNDKTVLADMVAYGKAFYFAKRMLPCVPDSTLIWYSAEEIRGAAQHQNLIWHRFIEDEVLYSTSHMVRQRFLGDRPKTLEVGEKCPGRIGQWVGWQIVNEYMDIHPSTTLPELMAMSDAKKLFTESKYRPQGK